MSEFIIDVRGVVSPQLCFSYGSPPNTMNFDLISACFHVRESVCHLEANLFISSCLSSSSWTLMIAFDRPLIFSPNRALWESMSSADSNVPVPIFYGSEEPVVDIRSRQYAEDGPSERELAGEEGSGEGPGASSW